MDIQRLWSGLDVLFSIQNYTMLIDSRPVAGLHMNRITETTANKFVQMSNRLFHIFIYY